MAGIGAKFFDIIDSMKSKDPDGTMAEVIEMLINKNPMLEDAYAIQCNNGTTHRHTIRTGLPTVAFGRLYKGIVQSKSTKMQVDDVTGFVEGLSTIDTRVLKLETNPGAVRLQEADAFLEAIAQEVQSKMLYANSNTAPEEFMGLAPRFNDTTAKNGNQIVLGGGAGADNTSIWIVTWGPSQVCTLYPKGTQAGVEREDMGRQRVLDSDNNPYFVLEEMFTQNIGVAVKDWRYVVRIPNIDISDLAAGSVDVYDLLTTAFYRHEGRRTKDSRSKTVVYMNANVREAMDKLATNAGSSDNFVRLKTTEVQGQEVDTWRGFMIRETDAILNTESVVS